MTKYCYIITVIYIFQAFILQLYETYFHLGLSYQQVGEHELALVNFSKAIHTATANQVSWLVSLELYKLYFISYLKGYIMAL